MHTQAIHRYSYIHTCVHAYVASPTMVPEVGVGLSCTGHVQSQLHMHKLSTIINHDIPQGN